MKMTYRNRRMNMTTVLRCLLSALVLGVSLLSFDGAWGAERRVLLLHSYHSGYAWTDRITAEVRNVLQSSEEPVTLFVEYMDTKRTLTERDFPAYAELLEARFSKARPDVVLCSDDMALLFFVEYRDRLFPGAPAVFCGISSPRTLLSGQPAYLTGVMEDYDLEKTIDFALRLFPRTRRLAVVSDATHLGILSWERLQAMSSRLVWQTEIIPLVNLTLPSLLERAADLPADSVILFLTFFADPEGRTFNDMSEVVGELHRVVSVPIFTPWSFLIHPGGALGGHVVTPQSQGRLAAERVLRILRGENPGDMPILWESPKVTMVQYDEMRSFGIPRDALPPDVLITGIPESLFGKYRDLVIVAGVALVLLILMVLLLGINVYRRRHAEGELRNHIQFLDLLIDTVPFPLYFSDSEGRFGLVNLAFARLAGRSREEVIGRTREEIFGDSPRGLLFQSDSSPTDDGSERQGVDLSVLESSGRRHYSHVSRDVLLPGTGGGKVGLVIDITERKRLEEDLRTREERLKLALEGGATGTWDWDIERDVVTLTGGWVSRFGRRKEDHQTDLRGWLSLIHPEESALVERALQDHCRGETGGFSEEHRIEVREGEWSWVLDRGRVVARDVKGTPLRFSGVLTDISEQKEVERRRRELEGQLRKAATTDRLTGTLNRQYFESLLGLQIRRSQVDGSPLSLIMFDIDDFKSVNDSFGHLAGDRVLVSVCETVRAHIRQQDYFGRWGGEEFTLLILGGEDSALQVAEKLRVMVGDGDHGVPRKVTISMGISSFNKGDRAEDLVRRADEKLYRAKRQGKNRVEGPKRGMHGAAGSSGAEKSASSRDPQD